MMRAPQENMEPIEQASGFPSPATDYKDISLDLNLLIIKHPASTEIFEFLNEGGEVYNINTGDLLVIDRSVFPRPGQLVLKERNNERFITRYQKNGARQDGGVSSRILATVTWVLKPMG
jgi:SOS-response transcriptional repressor LexA